MLVKMQQSPASKCWWKCSKVQQASVGEPAGHLVGQQVTAGGPSRLKTTDCRKNMIILTAKKGRLLCQSEDLKVSLVLIYGRRGPWGSLTWQSSVFGSEKSSIPKPLYLPSEATTAIAQCSACSAFAHLKERWSDSGDRPLGVDSR